MANQFTFRQQVAGSPTANGEKPNLKRKFAKTIAKFIPAKLSNRLLKFSVIAADSEFVSLAHKRQNAPNADFTFRNLAKLGFSPRFIVDVGAYEGNWTKQVLSIWPTAAVMMCEPNPAKQEILAGIAERENIQLCQELLGAVDGKEVVFNLMETGSSVFNERSSVARTQQKLKLRSLDSLANGRKIDFLKLDAQGYEIEILKGAAKSLKQVEVLVLEMSLLPINEGAPLFDEVVAYLSAQGFVLYDIIEFHRRKSDRALWQLDGVFVPINSSLRHDTTLDLAD